MPTENKRASAEVHTAKASPPKKRQHTISQSQDRSSDSFQGFNFCNLGGSGDCAYRALAAAFAFQSERDPKEAVSASQQLGATLRAQMSSQLEKHHHFRSTFSVDSRWTEALEDGAVPKTYEEWISATLRPNRWIDGPGLSTAATRLSRKIAIWKNGKAKVTLSVGSRRQ